MAGCCVLPQLAAERDAGARIVRVLSGARVGLKAGPQAGAVHYAAGDAGSWVMLTYNVRIT
jgi:hypothetical protein